MTPSPWQRDRPVFAPEPRWRWLGSLLLALIGIAMLLVLGAVVLAAMLTR